MKDFKDYEKMVKSKRHNVLPLLMLVDLNLDKILDWIHEGHFKPLPDHSGNHELTTVAGHSGVIFADGASDLLTYAASTVPVDPVYMETAAHTKPHHSHDLDYDEAKDKVVPEGHANQQKSESDGNFDYSGSASVNFVHPGISTDWSQTLAGSKFAGVTAPAGFGTIAPDNFYSGIRVTGALLPYSGGADFLPADDYFSGSAGLLSALSPGLAPLGLSREIDPLIPVPQIHFLEEEENVPQVQYIPVHNYIPPNLPPMHMCMLALTYPVLNPTPIYDMPCDSRSGNLVIDSGAYDNDGSPIHVDSVSFDAGTSSPGISAGPGVITDGHEIITIYFDGTIEIGTLNVNLSTGAYTYANAPGADKLPIGANIIEFQFVLGEAGMSCTATGTLNVTVEGGNCMITIPEPILNPPPIWDDMCSSLSGNIIVDSGAYDGNGTPIHVDSVSFDAGTSSKGITAGSPDLTSVPGHELINVFYDSTEIGTLNVTLATGAYTYSNSANADVLPEGKNVIEFNFTLGDGMEGCGCGCTATGTLNVTVEGGSCMITLCEPILNPPPIYDDMCASVMGNIIVDSGASDGNGSPIHVDSVAFDAATSSKGITAGTPDLTSVPGHELINVFYDSTEIGTLNVTLATGAYTYANSANADVLPEGKNVIEFKFTLGDGMDGCDCGCTATGTLNVTVEGGSCMITLCEPILNPPPIYDDMCASVMGNIIVDSGASDGNGSPIHVDSVAFDAATSSKGITAGTPDLTSVPGHELINVFYDSTEIGTLNVTLATGAYTYANSANADVLPEGKNVIEFKFTLGDGMDGCDCGCTATGTLNVTVEGGSCMITLCEPILNPPPIYDDMCASVMGNIIVDSGAADGNGSPIHVDSVAFDAGTSSKGITAGTPDLTSVPGHELINVFYDSTEIGTLNVTLATGAYTYANSANADVLPEGKNVIEFKFTLGDGMDGCDCGCTATGTLNVTVEGGSCMITLCEPILNPPPIYDDMCASVMGNIIVDSGASDGNGSPIHVDSVAFDAATSSKGITAGTPDLTSVPGHELINVFYDSTEIGTLNVTLATGAYTYANSANADVLPEGKNVIEFKFTLGDGMDGCDCGCTATGTLNVTVEGGSCMITLCEPILNPPPIYDDMCASVMGNIIVDSGASDGNGSPIHVDSVAFDAATSSKGITAGTPDLTSVPGHELINVFYDSTEIGTLNVTLATGAYTYANSANADVLPEGKNVIEFKFTLGDGMDGCDCGCTATGTLNVTVEGGSCMITLCEPILNPPPIYDDMCASVMGNIIVDSGASDGNGSPIHVDSVAFDAATSSKGITAGTPDLTSVPGHELINVFYDSTEIGTLNVTLATGAYTYANSANADVLPEGKNVIEFKFTLGDGMDGCDCGCTATGTLNVTVEGGSCMITLCEPILNPPPIYDDMCASVMGNIIVDSGAADGNGSPIHVDSVAFDAGTSSKGITAGTPDLTSVPGHELINVFYDSTEIGTLNVTLATGAYTYANSANADVLPEGKNVIEFKFTLGDGMDGCDCGCTATGTLNVTVEGGSCMITLCEPILNPPPIYDDMCASVMGNIIVDSGAADGNGSPIHVDSVAFDAGTSSKGITAGTPDLTSVPGHELINVFYDSTEIGTLNVTLATGAYTYSNSANADVLPEGKNVIEFNFTLGDGMEGCGCGCTATGTLNVTVEGGSCMITLCEPILNPPPIYDDMCASVMGNIIVDSGAADGNGSPIHVDSVAFDAGTSSKGITAGTPDLTSVPGHELINVFYDSTEIGTLNVTLATGAYTYANSANADVLPEGKNVIEFKFTLGDGMDGCDCGCTATGTLNVTVEGGSCMITLCEPILNPPPIYDDMCASVMGNIIVDSGAADGNGSPIHVDSVAFDAGTSSKGITAGTPDLTSVPGHELINVFYDSTEIGTLNVTLATGAYTYANSANADVLPEGKNVIEFKFTLGDGMDGCSCECTATGTLNVSVEGGSCEITLCEPVLNPAPICAMPCDSVAGNLVVDTGAHDTDNAGITVSNVAFDAGSSSSHITAGAGLVSNGHEIITVYFNGTTEIGTLNVNLSTGAYTYNNTAGAENLPDGPNTIEFKFTLSDSMDADGCMCGCSVDATLNITVVGDEGCKITLCQPVLNPPAICDDTCDSVNGNLVVDTGAHDNENAGITVSSVAFDAGSSSSHITAGAGVVSNGHETFAVYFSGAEIGTLNVNLSTGAYTYNNTAGAENLPDGLHTIEFNFTLSDSMNSDGCMCGCSADGVLNISVAGDEGCKVTLCEPVLNPCLIGDAPCVSVVGNLVVDTGAHDNDGAAIHVSNVAFDAGSSSTGITAGAGVISNGHEDFNVYFDNNVQIGTLDVNLSSGAYTYSNTAGAEKLPMGDNTIEFNFTLDDGMSSKDYGCDCSAQGTLNVSVLGAGDVIVNHCSDKFGSGDSYIFDVETGSNGKICLAGAQQDLILNYNGADCFEFDDHTANGVLCALDKLHDNHLTSGECNQAELNNLGITCTVGHYGPDPSAIDTKISFAGGGCIIIQNCSDTQFAEHLIAAGKCEVSHA